ncbi:hypothetical protein Gotur_021127 [Gossypium turneri]
MILQIVVVRVILKTQNYLKINLMKKIVVVRVILKTQNYLKINLMKKKTSTDQDEDIKVSTYNSDEEKTLSEEKNIEIPEPMFV